MATIKGCYQWNAILNPPSNLIEETVNFRAFYFPEGEHSYDGITIESGAIETELNYIDTHLGENLYVYGNGLQFQDGCGETRLIDFGEAEQEISDEFHAYLTANAVSADWNTVVESMYAFVSGEWKWNDTLPYCDPPILFQIPITINGEVYQMAGIGDMHSNGTNVTALVMDAQYNQFLVYDSDLGYWIEANDGTQDPVKSDLYQTWDFGTGSYIEHEQYAYLTANATPVNALPSDKVNVVYDGDLIASLDGGQRATLHCGGKKMKSDITIFTYASSGGAELNIAYGDTAPTDTSKLWVKTAEPLSVAVKLNANVTGNDGLLSGIAAIPTAACGIGAAAVGTKVYLFGGRIGTNDTSSNSYSSAIRVFDTETGTVETLSTTLPNKAEGIAAAAVGTKVYLFGGYYYSSGKVYSSAIRVFDTETGTIETLSATLPKGAYNMGAAAVGTKIYLFGGYISSTSANGSYISAIRVFNTETGTIETLSTTLPQPSEGTGAAAVGTKIYLFGGYRYYSGAEYLSAIRVFNTETGTIETLSTTLPTAAYKMGVAAVGTKIYLFGGVYSSYISRIDVFDTETGTIETLSTTLPTATYSMGTATVGTKVYLFGGCYSSTYYSSIHQFTALIDLPENHMMIEASAFENRFNLLPNLEIGVKNVYLGNAEGKGERVAAALYKDGAWVEI